MMETVIIKKIRKKSTTRSGTFFHTIYHFILITAFWFLRMVGMIWLRITRMVWMIPVAFLLTMIIMKIRKKSTTRSCTFFHTIYHFLLITSLVVVEQSQVNKILISLVDISISYPSEDGSQ